MFGSILRPNQPKMFVPMEQSFIHYIQNMPKNTDVPQKKEDEKDKKTYYYQKNPASK